MSVKKFIFFRQRYFKKFATKFENNFIKNLKKFVTKI